MNVRERGPALRSWPVWTFAVADTKRRNGQLLNGIANDDVQVLQRTGFRPVRRQLDWWAGNGQLMWFMCYVPCQYCQSLWIREKKQLTG
jgi:hypothetical protein